MEEVLSLLGIIEKAGGDPESVLSWMDSLIVLGEDYATNGPARPSKDDPQGRESVQYALLVLRYCSKNARELWEATNEP
jgi:epoxyqueuosine reductase QueG